MPSGLQQSTQRLDEPRGNRMVGPRILTSDKFAIDNHVGVKSTDPVVTWPPAVLKVYGMLKYIFA